MDAKQLPKCLQRFADRIDAVLDDRNGKTDNGYCVYLVKDGPGSLPVIHEKNPSECASRLSRLIRGG